MRQDEINFTTKLSKVRQLLSLAKQYQALLAEPEHYNLFSVLRSKNDEVRLHSRFLTDLLNPEGRHRLAHFPLKRFLENVCQVEVTDGNFDFDVKAEYQNIDIFLANFTTKQAIIIENKIDAVDQDQQLLRYFLSVKQLGFKSITVVYLTLDGRAPSPESVKGQSECLNDYEQTTVNISYSVDVLHWVNAIIEKSATQPALRESLIQYTEILKELTNMTNNQALLEALKRLLIETQSIDVVDVLQEAKIQLQSEAVVSLWERLGEKLAKRFELKVDHSEEAVKHLVSGFFAPRSGTNHVDFKVPFESISDSYLSVICESGDALSLGVETSNNDEIIKSLPITLDCEGNDYWPIYKYITYQGEYWDFKKLSSDQISLLHDPEFIDGFVDEIVQEVALMKNKIESGLTS
ncbi:MULTISPECIES: PD-(D/E)XK nuclease family protein [Marinomonas]|uniref:PD-(D/E)XK nuclease family protein n=1 Tax=Marinomonas arctica TaxID=383750 RepID=A0A7H1J753_9GAMM|nr:MULTISPECIES: PD-(D/E)XK nuclease family protein [Marinomonas]MCS7485717.1 hypothetical protein [Marinomonas sp. BSi20414]QNT06319.1 PD-(D/E)XK nuclease family protein [Marinomonas arctica]GGN28674.1 hypothetical protein GCM10011350_20550 [Marinomonas arctica]